MLLLLLHKALERLLQLCDPSRCPWSHDGTAVLQAAAAGHVTETAVALNATADHATYLCHLMHAAATAAWYGALGPPMQLYGTSLL